ncbi:MAG: hypothetical protein FH749_13340 [Firmicutes bacterium]|nr:hypothetical protein [Bacillota bacterium]
MEKKLRKLIRRKFSLYPRTEKIIEVQEELYSIMLDKYSDCLEAGMSKEESFKRATEMIAEYKDAIKEVETGSSLSALKQNLINTASFSAFYFIAVTFVYLFVSMVVLQTFENTWLIVVGGVFLYLLYFSVSAYQYARLFNFKTLARCGIALVYFSLIPLLYVFPSLYLSVVHAENIWSFSWLSVLIIGFLYIMSDYIVYRKQISSLEKDIHLLAAGFLLTTVVYLSVSIWFGLWSVTWLIYVLYLGLVSMVFFITEKGKKNIKGNRES